MELDDYFADTRGEFDDPLDAMDEEGGGPKSKKRMTMAEAAKQTTFQARKDFIDQSKKIMEGNVSKKQKQNRGRASKQKQNTAPVVDFGKELQVEVALVEGKLDVRSPLESHDPSTSTQCSECVSDPTMTIEAKQKLWRPGQTKHIHDIQWHSPYPRANRLVRANVKDGVWRCPHIVGEGGKEGEDEDEDEDGPEDEDDEGDKYPCAKSYSHKGKGLKAIRRHLLLHHPLTIPEELIPAFDETTRAACRADVARMIEDEI